jgi:hypothetical protein
MQMTQHGKGLEEVVQFPDGAVAEYSACCRPLLISGSSSCFVYYYCSGGGE